ncbi:hypothetical protein BU25DRAFT_346348 [Macroventuria anomochaeta]|uniref:Uncharacterized protein n=1 Tax=Macroventuria anomochaeta TaxID=301207 RepID=A0ACB6RUE5_9PLEO|nr:uncharacterized protein BU25DRAFT_346348 [Macroventuria anomochaeta]KAF2625363.1 hypothetical protein BU25DRAFT_346348 [Macroventuria anomochaeta]
MSGYKGPRGPNVSQYIANLNQLSPLSDNPAEPQPVTEDFSAFLNTDFFDINGGINVDLNSPIDFGVDFDIKPSTPSTAEHTPRNSISAASSKPNMDFNLNGDFQFTDFSNFNTAPIIDTSMPSLSQPQHNNYPLPTTYAPQPNAISPINYDDSASKKRKAEDMSVGTPIQHLDEHARVAAEEDKRRRNTAASARFRVKKKQREQALEKTAKDMSDRVQQLEARIGQLETENAWLKGLITEKSNGNSSTSDIKAMLTKHEEQKAGRSSPAHAEGVGTTA